MKRLVAEVLALVLVIMVMPVKARGDDAGIDTFTNDLGIKIAGNDNSNTLYVKSSNENHVTGIYALGLVPLYTEGKNVSKTDVCFLSIVKAGSSRWYPVVYRVDLKSIEDTKKDMNNYMSDMTSLRKVGKNLEDVSGEKQKLSGITWDMQEFKYKAKNQYKYLPSDDKEGLWQKFFGQHTEKAGYAGLETFQTILEELAVAILDDKQTEMKQAISDDSDLWVSLALCFQLLGSQDILVPVIDEVIKDLVEGKDVSWFPENSYNYQVTLRYIQSTTSINGVQEENQSNEFIKFYIGGATEDESFDSFSQLMNVLLCMDETTLTTHTNLFGTSTELAQFLNSYNGLRTKIDDAIKQQHNENSVAVIAKLGWDDNDTEFEKWSKVFKMALAGKNLFEGGMENIEVQRLSEIYNIKNFKNWYQQNKILITREEYLRLQAYYELVYRLAVKGNGEIDEAAEKGLLSEGIVDDSNTESWSYGADVKGLGDNTSGIEISTSGYSKFTLRNNAVVVGKDTKYNVSNTNTLTAVANNFSDIVMYYAAQVGGIGIRNPLYVDAADNGEEDISTIDRNDSIETMLNVSNYTEAEHSQKTGLAWSYIPGAMKRLRWISISDGDSDPAYDAYKVLQYALLLANTYASSSFYSGLKQVTDEEGKNTGEFVNEELDEYLSQWTEQYVTDSDNSAVYRYAVAYTNIADGLSYLGVEPFSPELKALVRYANRMKGLVDISAEDLSGKIDAATEPLSNFFSVSSDTFSYYYNLGVALSASYIPMQTNMYDIASMWVLDDSTFVEQFHYPYGFFRKSLYIDTDPNAATNLYVSGKSGNKRVAILRDLLECEKDIVLYVDDKFYNVDILAEIQNMTYRKVTNTDTGEELTNDRSLWNKFTDWISGTSNVTAEEILKTAGYQSYSDNVRKDVESSYVQGVEDSGTSGLVLSSKEIDTYLTGYSENADDKIYNEYTPLEGFAVVSAIYKNTQLYSKIRSQTEAVSPVFVSSPNVAGIEGVSQEYWNTIYNYLMLKNLPGNMSVDYKTTLDLDSQVYVDIYGNILTESGLVIIPAAANPTLQNAASYDIHTAAFLTLADNGYYEIPQDYENAVKYAGGINTATGTTSGAFLLNSETKTWQIASKKINGIYYNFRDLPIADKDVITSLVNIHKQRLATNNNMKFNRRIYLITEVLRGAPLEWIDKQKEGLSLKGDLSKQGIYGAAKLEEISDSLLSSSNGNSLLSFPNLAFMDHYEVVIMFLYKLLFAVMLIVMFVKLYMDVMQRRFGLKSVASFLLTVILFVAVLYAVPEVLNFSYYATNKALLQDEALYIATLNLEKRNDGMEIGVTSVDKPSSETVLYLKMDDVDVAWYEAVGQVLSVNSMDTMQDIYERAVSDSVMAQLEGVTVRGNAVYMDVNTIFDSTNLEYDSKTEMLKNVTVGVPYASYVTPYYAILDCLVSRVNAYNKDNGTLAFSTVVQNKGEIRTRGLVQGYFTSDLFMEQSLDPSALYAVYGLETGLVESTAFTAAEREAMKKSLWYSESSEAEVREKLQKLNEKARDFIAKNHTVIGKVSDETFLKVMALYLALEHNKAFHCKYGNGLEIFDIDTKDIMRLSLTDRVTVLSGSSKSFARFVYDEAGGLGTVATMLLVLVYFVLSIIKPVVVLAVLLTMVVTLIVRRLFKKDAEHVIEGFIVSLLLLCGVNVLYALMLKGCLLLPRLGLSPIVAIFGQILIQVVYGGAMYVLLSAVMKDWRNLGYAIYEQKVQKISAGSVVLNKISLPAVVNVMDKGNAAVYRESMLRAADSRRHVTKGVTGKQILESMRKRDKKKEEGVKG